MPDDDQYRRAVQGRVEELLSKRHNTSTSRLLVEAMVEGMKLYRIYREQEEDEKRKRESDEKKGHKIHRKGSHRDKNEEDGHRQRHDHIHRGRTDRSKNGHRHEHRGRLRDRSHRRHRDGSHGRHRFSSRGKYNDVSLGVHRDTSGSRDSHSNYHSRGETDNVHDSTTVSREENHLMSGANRYQASEEDLISDPRPHSVPDQVKVSDSRRMPSTSDRSRTNTPKTQPREQFQSSERKKNFKSETERVSMAHNAHQRGKQDDSLSRHQSRVHHRHSDACAGKTGVSHSPMRRQRGPGGTPFGSLPRYKSKAGIALGLYDHFVNTYKQIKAEQDAGYRAKGLVEKAFDGARKKNPDVKTSKVKQGRSRKAPEQHPGEGEHGDSNNEEARPMHPQAHASGSLQDQNTSNPPVEEPETSFPIMPHAPLPPPLAVRDANNARAALLNSIQGGVRLRRVASLDKKGTSASSRAGKVLYEATEHSQEVEERERAQAEGETDPGPEPNKAFREDLLNALEGRKAKLGRTSHAA